MPGPVELFTEWHLDAVPATAIFGAALLYRWGVARLEGRGRRWPHRRTLAFAGALGVGLLATQSGIARHDHAHLSVHMLQHVLLGMVLPLLVVLAAPITLALQSAPTQARRKLRAAVHSRPALVLTHPLTGWTLFGGGLVALYLTPLLDVTTTHHALHVAVHAHMVAAGMVLLAPLVGIDPMPRRLPYPARLLALLMLVPFHTVVALGMLSASTPIAPEAYPVLSDQHRAAAIFWGTGEIFTLLAVGIVLRHWWVAEQRAAAREDRALLDLQPASS